MNKIFWERTSTHQEAIPLQQLQLPSAVLNNCSVKWRNREFLQASVQQRLLWHRRLFELWWNDFFSGHIVNCICGWCFDMHMGTVYCTNGIMYATHLVETCLNYHLVCHTVGKLHKPCNSFYHFVNGTAYGGLRNSCSVSYFPLECSCGKKPNGS